jgi:hypothetical protein
MSEQISITQEFQQTIEALCAQYIADQQEKLQKAYLGLEAEVAELRKYKDTSMVKSLSVQLDRLQTENALLKKKLRNSDTASIYSAMSKKAEQSTPKPKIQPVIKKIEQEPIVPVSQRVTEWQKISEPPTSNHVTSLPESVALQEVPAQAVQEPEQQVSVQVQEQEPMQQEQEPMQQEQEPMQEEQEPVREEQEPMQEEQEPVQEEQEPVREQEHQEEQEQEPVREQEHQEEQEQEQHTEEQEQEHQEEQDQEQEHQEEQESELWILDLKSGKYFWNTTNGDLHQFISQEAAGDVVGLLKTVIIKTKYYYVDMIDNSVYEYLIDNGNVGERCGTIVNKKFVKNI